MVLSFRRQGRVKRAIANAILAFVKIEGTAKGEFYRLAHESEIRHNLVTWSARTAVDRKNMIAYLSDLISGRKLDRVRYFRDLMRLERLRGNDLIAATYGLRIIRWLGKDHFHLLDFITQTLRGHGFNREAEAAEAMYRDADQSAAASSEFLRAQLQKHRTNPDRPFAFVDDRRNAGTPRVSVIVSLYRAADKLPTFMRMLQQQTIFRAGDAEVIFIDSGSPTNEYSEFKSILAQQPFPAVYARSEKRETIQTAWNRGIKLANGRYLAFLGADEGVHPECLHILADELDHDSKVDWVIADSIVTAVDKKAIFDRDVMMYDRKGYRHQWHYLDCTFLSYVGGLYRRDIHDRFGYYDETFQAAGDTEFKNRILPFITSKHVLRSLGVFNNYPEERTTQHPRAEIEDLRAWYLHRTVSGMAYAFDNRPVEEAIQLLKDTFAYRKCFCLHTSTDIDLAASLTAYLATRDDAGQWRNASKYIQEILGIYAGFELLPSRKLALIDQAKFAQKWRRLMKLRRVHQTQFDLDGEPAYKVFNDNRYEQHWWSWSV